MVVGTGVVHEQANLEIGGGVEELAFGARHAEIERHDARFDAVLAMSAGGDATFGPRT